MPLRSQDKKYGWENISRVEWWLDRVKSCRRKRSAIELLKGILSIVLVFAAIAMYYFLKLVEQRGFSWLRLDPTIIAVAVALFVGFVMGAVYRSPGKIARMLNSWRNSWQYHEECVEKILKAIETSQCLDAEQKKRYETARQTLYGEKSMLSNARAFKNTRNPYKKLELILTEFVDALKKLS